MILTSKTKYAFNIVGFLSKEAGRITTAKEIANLYALSPSFVESAMRDLRECKIVSAVRGPGGGYLLAPRTADDALTIGHIISATDTRSEQQELFVDSVCEGIVKSFGSCMDEWRNTPVSEFLQ